MLCADHQKRMQKAEEYKERTTVQRESGNDEELAAAGAKTVFAISEIRQICRNETIQA